MRKDPLLRPVVQQPIPLSWKFVEFIFSIHAMIRSGGLWNASKLSLLSKVIIWNLQKNKVLLFYVELMQAHASLLPLYQTDLLTYQ